MKKNNNLLIWALVLTLLLIATVMSYFTQPEELLLQQLPTWQVNNPVSKVFVIDKIPPTAGSLAAGNSTVPNEYLDDPAIDTLLLIMEAQGTYLYKTSTHPSGIVGSNDIVIIKGSFQWDFRNTTSTDRIKGLIWQILQHPDGFTGEILVGDNTQWASIGEDDNNSEDTQQSIVDVVNTFHSKGYPVHLFRWADIMNNVVTEYSDGDYNDGYTYEPISKITYPKFKSPAGNYISLKYGIWNETTQTYNHDRLCIIDFPVLKAHGWTGATLAIKNWIGVLTVAYQNERYGGSDNMHQNYFFGEYALPAKVMQVTYPKLTIIDAAWTNPERNYGNIAIQLKMLLGSTDPFAASWYAAKYMLTPVAYYPEKTNPDNVGGLYNKCLNNWINCMHDSGFAVTKDSSEISVYDRAELNTIKVDIKVFLEGSYIDSEEMSTTLNAQELIPKHQPFQATPWNYFGTEAVATFPNNAVDWVLIELRSDLTNIVNRRAVLLLSNGGIVDIDGSSSVAFKDLTDGDYYVVVKHRNHLAIMTSFAISLSSSPSSYNFTTSESQAYGTNAIKNFGDGIFGMYTGDGNQDGFVTSTDFNIFNPKFTSASSGYEYSDWNLDGFVTSTDFNLFNPNFTTARHTFVP